MSQLPELEFVRHERIEGPLFCSCERLRYMRVYRASNGETVVECPDCRGMAFEEDAA